MITFIEYCNRRDEGVFDGWRKEKAPQPQKVQVPSLLAYHIAEAINKMLIAAGKMSQPGNHTPYGANDPLYDAALKSRLRDHFYGIAQQMVSQGDQEGVMDYFGFDLARNRAVAMGRFVDDLGKELRQAA